MPTDSSIPMQVSGGQGAPLDTATAINAQPQIQAKNAMSAEQLLNAHYQNLGERDKQRLQSSIAGATQLKPYLDQGDIAGAQNFLMTRKADLQQKMSKGENVDTQETDYALQALQQGPQGVKELQNDVNGLFAAGQVYGITSPEANKQFKLAPGETQYDQTGKPIATAPINAGFGGIGAGATGGPVNTTALAAGPNGNAQQGGQTGAKAQPGQSTDAPMDGTGGVNPSILQGLDQGTAGQVKALAEGRQAFPTGNALKSPYWQAMLNAVSQYDPSFDAVNYNSRMATRKDFTSGKSAQNITSLNTAMGHLSKLSDAYDQLDNSSVPSYNRVANYLGNATGIGNSQTATSNVAVDAIGVAGELAKVFRSTGMSEGEINDWKSKISTDASPAQSKAVIKSAFDLMDSRLEALGTQYNQGMGTTKHGVELLSPAAQTAYYKLTGAAPLTTSSNQQQSTVPAGKIHVSNGQKAFYINQGDLAAAAKDGFKQVQ